MPRVLAAKACSLGDATRAIPDMMFDWVVGQTFGKVPGCATQLIRRSTRRCHKYPIRVWRAGEWAQFKEQVDQFDTSFTGVVR